VTEPLASNRRSIEISTKPTFIIGSPRSGTTILAWSLAQHSQLWTSEESVILEDLYGAGRVHNSYQSLTVTPVKNWFKAEHVEKQELLQHLGIGINALFSSRSQGRRWIDQTPSYTFLADTLADMFPDARFLHVLRVNAIEPDTRAERLEAGIIPLWATDFRTACKTWRRYVLKAMQFSTERQERCLTVRYEQLVTDPELCFQNTLHFLDLEYESAPAEHFQTHRINSSFTNRRVDPWSSWSSDQRSIFVQEAGDALALSEAIDSKQVKELQEDTSAALRASHQTPEQPTAQEVDGCKAFGASLQDQEKSREFSTAFPDSLICPNPIFVIGAQRSGTSILARSLAKHSTLWYSIEGDIFYYLFGPDRIDEAYRRHSGRDWSWLVREKVGRDEFAQAVGLGINALYTSRSAGKRWIEKLPENSLMAEVLASMFPGALFVNILRDARYAVNSGFRKRRKRPTAEDFLFACRAWRSFAEKASAAVFEFLGLSFEKQCVDHFRTVRFNSSFSDLADTHRDPWDDWTLEQRRVFLQSAAPLMVKLGQLSENEFKDLEQEALIKSG
jgi:Sulfotransferase family